MGAVGDLSEPRCGVAEGLWVELAQKVDIVMHNGALVHWVYPYSKLKPMNVDSTKELLRCVAWLPDRP